MSKRKITVYGTKGENNVSIETDVKSWGELRTLFEDEGVVFDGLLVTENVGKTTLQHTDAILPEGNFVVFARPEKTKSGVDTTNLGFKELRAIIKADSEAAKVHLEGIFPGINWTRLGTDQLKEGLASFGENNTTDATVEEVEEVSSTNPVAVALEAFKKAVTVSGSDEADGILEDIEEELDSIVHFTGGENSDTPVTDEGPTEEEIAQKAKEEEEDRLQAEMEDMNEGF